MSYQLSTLKNGIKLITVPMAGAKSLTILVLVKVGSRYENRRTNGLSHFVEHLMFKGTKKRPQTKMIVQELDGYGAEYNAFTSKDHTGYYIKLRADKAQEAADILQDMLFHSLFKREELERERLVIFEEIKMYDENPMMDLENIFEETLYGDAPLGWRVAGTKERVGSVKRDAVVNFVQKQYAPQNITIVCAGGIDKNLSRRIADLFSRGGGVLTKKQNQFLPYQHHQLAPKIFVKEKKLEQVQLGLGFEGRVSYASPDRYAAAMLATILGGSMSSRLFIEVRERRGLCYFIRSALCAYHDAGHIFIHSGLDAARLTKALTTIVSELKKIKHKAPSAQEMKRAQDYLIGRSTLSLEDSETVAAWYASSLVLTGKIEEPEEKFKKISAVTAEEVRAAAQKFFQPKNAALAVIGPADETKKYKKVLSGL